MLSYNFTKDISATLKTISDSARWQRAIGEMPCADFYHSFDYHSLDAERIGGEPRLFLFERDGHVAIMPVIVRVIPTTGHIKNSLYDATSVYGYSGPLCTIDSPPDEFVAEFVKELETTMDGLNIVSVFSRFHPLLGNEKLVDAMGRVEPAGHTVSIDLTIPEDAQLQKYSSNHRRNIRKLKRLGVTCEIGSQSADLDSFMEIYRQSMDRVNASSMYQFGRKYFSQLTSSGQFDMKLFLCRMKGIVVCGGLFSSCNGIVQYHLGGTDSHYLKYAPSKLMFETVREWAVGSGCRVFHLGGGVGGRSDTLFEFKKGFSDIRHSFHVWKWIVNEELFDGVCGNHGIKIDTGNRIRGYEGFFPAYRKVRE